MSGLAYGVDRLVHEWCLNISLPTISVLGTGILTPYPAKHAPLSDAIVEAGGVVLTEYLPTQGPSGQQFVWRNRLQAALGRATIPVEWKKKSGTAHTVRFSRKLARPVIGLALDGIRHDPDAGEVGSAIYRSERSFASDRCSPKEPNGGSAHPRWPASGSVRLTSCDAAEGCFDRATRHGLSGRAGPDRSPQRTCPFYPAHAGPRRPCRPLVPPSRQLHLTRTHGTSREFLSRNRGEVPFYQAASGNLPDRRRGGSINPILQHLGVQPHETILVGNEEEDMLAGVNNKLLLVRPEWYPGAHDMALQSARSASWRNSVSCSACASTRSFGRSMTTIYMSGAWGRSQPEFLTLRSSVPTHGTLRNMTPASVSSGS